MKPFLGIDLTADKKNQVQNGEELLAATPSLGVAQSLERSSESALETIENSKIPLPFRIVQWACLVVGIGLAGGIGNSWIKEETTFGEMYQTVPFLFWVTALCLAIGIALGIWGYRQEKSTLESHQSEQTFEDLGSACDAVFRELGIPKNAKEVDLLTFFYKQRKGEIKVCEKLLQPTPHVTSVFQMFVQENTLYFADLDGKYAIPLSGVQGIETVKKTIVLDSWNKDDEHNKGKYKPYRLKETQHGEIVCKTYHILRIFVKEEEWGVYFPCYELPVFEKMLGIKATEETE